ncbi:Fur family transcriptional regulator [Anoxybacterium hadale]|uniref:Fur family transcriptional regulator n=1 Tax=Anoxybacterium hadale TaxID=3408580 RepID=UPI003B00AA35
MNNTISYKTRQKDQVMEWLMQNKERHITADEIMEGLNQKSMRVGKATIYRHLDRLVSEGIIRKYFVDDGKSPSYQYQYVGSAETCSHHYHLKCLDCGRLIHLDCKYLWGMDSHIKDHHDFHVDHIKTVLYGQCGACAEKKACGCYDEKQSCESCADKRAGESYAGKEEGENE